MVLQSGKYLLCASALAHEKHDKNHDGYLTKDEVIRLSESLLVSSRAFVPPQD